MVGHEVGCVPDHHLFTPVSRNTVAPSLHMGTSTCLSSVQVTLTRTLPLWHLQLQVSEASAGHRSAGLHRCSQALCRNC